ALAIVLAVSLLSLGWRTGIVVALSVPLVLAIVLLVMYAAGIDLHRITLGALIIALGLLVDDAIIAIEMMVVKMEQGWDRARAAPEVIYDTRIYRVLRRVIELCLRWRKTVVALTILMFVAAVGGFGFVQQQFFPTSTRSELFFELRLPEGTAIGVTDATAKR